MVIPPHTDTARFTRLFNPIIGKGVTENVALQLETAILSGTLKPGDRLPSERELQGLFGTGRGVIREALRQLRQKGLIEGKKGGKTGSFVKKVDIFEASEPFALLMKQEAIPLRHIIEFRESMDRSVAVLAIGRAGPSEVEVLVELADALGEAGAADPPDLKRLAEVDRQLNIHLVRMAHNPIFEWVMRAIQIGFGSFDHILYEAHDYRDKTIGNWKGAVCAIAQREPLKAMSYIGHYYVMLNECIDDADRRRASDADSAMETT